MNTHFFTFVGVQLSAFSYTMYKCIYKEPEIKLGSLKLIERLEPRFTDNYNLTLLGAGIHKKVYKLSSEENKDVAISYIKYDKETAKELKILNIKNNEKNRGIIPTAFV